MSKTAIKLRSNTKYLQVIIQNSTKVVKKYHQGDRIGNSEDVRQATFYLGAGLMPDTLWYHGNGHYHISLCWGAVSFQSIIIPELEKKLKEVNER